MPARKWLVTQNSVFLHLSATERISQHAKDLIYAPTPGRSLKKSLFIFLSNVKSQLQTSGAQRCEIIIIDGHLKDTL
jgi:hypothetical protein